MKTKALFLFVSIFLLSLGSCIPRKTIKGDGNVVVEHISIIDFSKLEIAGTDNMIVNYTQSEGAPVLEIKTDKNIFDCFEFVVEEETLKILPKKEFRRNTNFRSTEFIVNTNSRTLQKVSGAGRIEFNTNSPITADELKFEMAGSGRVNLNDSVSVDELKIELAGSGNLQGALLKADEISANMAGSSKIILGGTARSASIKIAGSGNVQAYDCLIYELKCEIAGSGDIEASVENSIEMNVAGSGSIKYKGNPNVIKRNIMGSGSVTKVD